MKNEQLFRLRVAAGMSTGRIQDGRFWEDAGGIRIERDVQLRPRDFMACCALLARIEELLRSIEVEDRVG